MKKYLDQYYERGWVVIPKVFDKKLMNNIILDYEKNSNKFIDIQKKQGIYSKVIDTSHHSFLICKKMIKLLNKSKLTKFLDIFFNGKYILNTMGLSKVTAENDKLYTKKIHRDIRSFDGSSSLWINSLIMLTDSTKDNGATWILEKSRFSEKKPSTKYFFKNAIQAVGKAGDVLIFNGNLWHCAGDNSTSNPRYIITPFFSKPFIKQQLDYPSYFGDSYFTNKSTHIKQILGYYSRTPKNLEEFYQPDSKRFYRKDQG